MAEDLSWHHQLGDPDFPIEKDRYHLYIGLFCPFAHRVNIARKIKGLDLLLSVSVVKPYPKEDGGWRFPASEDEYPGSEPNPFSKDDKFLHDVYFRSPPSYNKYTGKYSVPVLWDRHTNQIVNNESLEIMRMLNHAFDDLLPENSKEREIDLYPEDLRPKIDEIDAWLMPGLNSGVYRAGFAEDQESYEAGCRTVFESLDRLEGILKEHNRPFMLGDRITDADIKAYATLVRFDAVYHQHFKVNIRSIRHDYSIINRYLKNLYWNCPGFKETTDFKHIKENYTKSHAGINPRAITPLGPIPEVESWTDEDEKWRKGWETDVKWPAKSDWREGRTFA